jgi:hypothetical protein
VRHIFLDWLRTPGRGSQLPAMGDVYDPLVEYAKGNRQPQVLAFHVSEVFWQLLVEGIVAPGSNPMNPKLPNFHVTDYGRRVLAAEAGHPHDEAGYLARVRTRVPQFDPTVLAYLTEALSTFRRGTPVASTVMLGIAAERVSLLVCESFRAALRDEGERATFDRILQAFVMKPKLDWVLAKLASLQNRRPPRPRELPPSIDREDAFTNLQMFPRYYQVAEELRQFLATNQV